MRIGCIFPGQGAQKVGMSKDLYDNYKVAKDVFDEVDAALGQNLSKVIFEGPDSELTLTENTQPALMACSMAALRAVEEKLGKKLPEFCSYVAGHSLGEFTALAAAGSITIGDCAKLLKIRGRAMQDAVPLGRGAMFALLGANITIAQEIASESDCEVANDNAPEQQVLSGAVEDIDRAIKIASNKGYKAIKLNVSAPFHSKLIMPAQEKLRAALENINILEPQVPLIANISADVIQTKDIKENLVNQVTGMVRWCESIRKMHALGATKIAEIGPGKVYTNLNKRIDTSIEAISTEDLLSDTALL